MMRLKVKASCRNFGILSGQNRKNWRARVGDLRDLRTSEASEGVKDRDKVSR